MSSFVFPGHPAYLETAAHQLDRPQFARAAGRITALTDLANLCSQASRADSSHVEAILAKAADFRDQIAIALHAAEAMMADVATARAAAKFAPLTNALGLDDPPESPVFGRVVARKAARGVSS